MLRIELFLNEKRIAVAFAVNMPKPGQSLACYRCGAYTVASPFTGAARDHDFEIDGHYRDQTAWALVAKMAAKIAELEGAKG